MRPLGPEPATSEGWKLFWSAKRRARGLRAGLQRWAECDRSLTGRGLVCGAAGGPAAGGAVGGRRLRGGTSRQLSPASPMTKMIGEDRDQGAFVEKGFEEDAVHRGGHFEGGFVGLDFGDHVAGGDLLAFVFHPTADQALLDTVAELGRLDGGSHYW